MEQPDPTLRSDSGRVVRRSAAGVHRRVGPWTPAVHGVLRHLERVGFAYAPRVVGFDDDGNEILTYLDGTSGPAVWPIVATDTGLAAFGRLLRSYHDAVEDYRPTGATWATRPSTIRPGDVVAHGDFGPWNTVWDGDRPVGILDWDLVGPRPRMYDLAYAAEYAVPYRDDHESTTSLGYADPPDRARRSAILAQAYRLDSADGLYEAVIESQEAGIAEVQVLAGAGVHPQVDWVRNGHLDELWARVAWSRANRDLFAPR